jgi:hypothetical protein
MALARPTWRLRGIPWALGSSSGDSRFERHPRSIRPTPQLIDFKKKWTTVADCLRTKRFIRGADCRSAVEGLRGSAAEAHRSQQRVPRTPPRRSLRLRLIGEAAGRSLSAPLAGSQGREHIGRYDGRRRRGQGRQSVQRYGELRLAARRRVHRRRYGRPALESHAGVRSRSGESQPAGRRKAAAHDADADSQCASMASNGESQTGSTPYPYNHAESVWR